MTTRAPLLLLAIAACDAGAFRPALDRVVPDQGTPAAALAVAIEGRDFHRRSVVDAHSGSVEMDDRFRAWLGDTELASVAWGSPARLAAEVPGGMAADVYDLRVLDPFGAEALLPKAFTVVTNDGSGGAGGASGAGGVGGAGGTGGASGGGGGGGTGGAGGGEVIWTVVESLTVPVDCVSSVKSATTLDFGKPYRLRGASKFMSNPVQMWEADAEYYDFAAPKDLAGGTDVGLGVDDAVSDGDKQPKWGPYAPSHIYEIDFPGTGQPIKVNYHDGNCSNNVGSLTLEILAPM